ncbi:acyl carrier protein [Thermocatellispora tengchongensis]|uniref:Acyl carrier protein n=1 Tax=Thermocatellispora tengchongensis TaxID=1073253 RepID=A0A840P478_9ACTN|nr:acyl carrier protein [Thermocatellispora tengchongensis]MBB5132290.1 acyl carrier protein [Thermocatellispora tengchongensis]
MTADNSASTASIRAWLTEQVALYVELAPEAIDHDTDLASYGMDSIRALTLAARIEDEFGIEVDEDLAWDHRTITAIAGVVAAELAKRVEAV